MDALSSARPLAEIPPDVCAGLSVVAFDLDDTFTTEGRIPAVAFDALWRAHTAGLRTVVVTGRPAGWADHIARMWPVDGVVAENGALWFRRAGRGLRRRFLLDDERRAANRARLDAIAAEILAAVPGAALASDQRYREFDLAIDWCEDVPRLPDESVDRVVSIFRSHGCTAKVSSIHVNGWFGEYDKVGLLGTFLRDELGVGADVAGVQVLFAGDSPNDEPLFEAFPVSVGVANVVDFRSRLRRAPAWIASRRGGQGFAEIVESVLGPAY